MPPIPPLDLQLDMTNDAYSGNDGAFYGGNSGAVSFGRSSDSFESLLPWAIVAVLAVVIIRGKK